MCKLIVIKGQNQGLIYELQKDEAILGRQSDNQVPIEDSKASRKHSRIFFEDGNFFLEDLRSRNGTLLNGEKIVRERLYSGDKIQIGATILNFRGKKEKRPEMLPLEEIILEENQTPEPVEPQKTPKAPKPLKRDELEVKIRKQKKFVKNDKQVKESSNFMTMNFSQHTFFQKVGLVLFILFFMFIITMISRWLTLNIID